jgi:5'-nucleotidase
MRILISNDDGVYSPGLHSLAEVASEFGDVRIFAPDVDRAASGHALTPDRPISWKATPLPIKACRVDGTPADCVAVGMARWKHVDVVLSGINLGSNIGNMIWNSGTLAAAKEGALLGARGIAISRAVPGNEPDYEALKPSLRAVLSLLLSRHECRLFNVNFPARRPRGIRWTRQSVRQYRSRISQAHDPGGKPLDWLSIAPTKRPEPDTDVYAVAHDYVSVTPLRLDVTDEVAFTVLRRTPIRKISKPVKTKRRARPRVSE